jgi:hypothetical protein
MEFQAQQAPMAPLDLQPPPPKRAALVDFRAQLAKLVLKAYPVSLVRQVPSVQQGPRVRQGLKELLVRQAVQVKTVLVQPVQQALLVLKVIKV